MPSKSDLFAVKSGLFQTGVCDVNENIVSFILLICHQAVEIAVFLNQCGV